MEAPVMEDHVTGFIDRIIADSWDKMSVKVRERERCKFCGSSTSMKETGQRQILHVAFLMTTGDHGRPVWNIAP